MANFDYRVIVSDTNQLKISNKKLITIESLAYAMSNKAIAEEVNLSVKSVERILSELNTKFNEIRSNDLRKYFNPRLRLLASLISNGALDYESEAGHKPVSALNENLTRTLILSCIGFSNKSISSLLNITEKTVELRFSQLFDYFNIDTKTASSKNPRVSLFISAYCRDNINKNQIKRLYRESKIEFLDSVFANQDDFLKTLEVDHRFIG